ncbi:MAG: hypothetical protein LBC48_05865 [Dysgonamonadaceae bacterium]|jgi:hypothetical protein|nr:hypothetical protein [Dysgonamonadaceae bacterium]
MGKGGGNASKVFNKPVCHCIGDGHFGYHYEAAVLDLNPDDNPTHTNIGGLALPRLELTENDMSLNGAVPVNGMLVYNTEASLEGAGVYVWINGTWEKASIGSVTYAALPDNLFETK